MGVKCCHSKAQADLHAAAFQQPHGRQAFIKGTL